MTEVVAAARTVKVGVACSNVLWKYYYSSSSSYYCCYYYVVVVAPECCIQLQGEKSHSTWFWHTCSLRHNFRDVVWITCKCIPICRTGSGYSKWLHAARSTCVMAFLPVGIGCGNDGLYKRWLSILRGNRLSSTTCFTEVSSTFTLRIVNHDDPWHDETGIEQMIPFLTVAFDKLRHPICWVYSWLH